MRLEWKIACQTRMARPRNGKLLAGWGGRLLDYGSVGGVDSFLPDKNGTEGDKDGVLDKDRSKNGVEVLLAVTIISMGQRVHGTGHNRILAR